MSSYNLEFVRKIVICNSSHIILQINLSLAVVPADYVSFYLFCGF
ncbi:hypothetical protein LEP1GSC008_1653 [Leptospira kirschneri serovar Bulgarica str. Nikolaevo]|uniref:Uncharacterized protein n=1 Tax=Leptospira kirschneri serovar Bulgarica str. Nikolaevo TaxID=1240687 RepID=M6FGS0_9LEPT|nr:hypothetical protein LEP1GSC008_1653 [Leptospira kirschneri serovar Bulgarica str. Nikolaevo]